MIDINEIVQRLGGGTRSGKGYMVKCPCHHDQAASLSVAIGDNGKLICHCHAGCDFKDILNVINPDREWQRQQMPTTTPTKIGKIKKVERVLPSGHQLDSLEGVYRKVKYSSSDGGSKEIESFRTFDYKEKDGSLILKVCRIDLVTPANDEEGTPAKREKTYRPILRVGEKWAMSLGSGMVKPLYNLPEVTKKKNSLIFLVEGEKAADALNAIGLTATTCMSSASSNTDWSPLVGKAVCIWPDFDVAGEAYLRDVTGAIEGVDGNTIIKVIRPYGVVNPDTIRESEFRKCDSYDWIEDRRAEDRDDDSIRDEIVGMYQAAKVVGKDNQMPIQISLELPPVDELDVEILPEPFQQYCKDNAERACSNLEYIAMSCISTAATCIGNRLSLRPKKNDSWRVVPNAWGYVVGDPSQKKTSMVEAPKRFLNRLEKATEEQHKDARREYDVAMSRFDQELRAKQADHEIEPHEVAKWIKENEPEAPPKITHVLNEFSVEALRVVLKDNPNGQLLVYRDEIAGMFEKVKDDPITRSFMLEAYNGDGSFKEMKIGRGENTIDRICFSMMGTIQPDRLADFITAETTGAGDGFNQRFQFAVWPDPIKQEFVDKEPDLMAERDAYLCWKRLVDMDPVKDIGAKVPLEHDALMADIFNTTDNEVKPGLPFIRLSDEAYGLYQQWHKWHSERLADFTIKADLKAHIGKMPKTLMILALVNHLCDTPQGDVSRHAMAKAIKMCDFLLSHANRIYSTSFNDVAYKAWSIAKEKILTGELGSEFTAWDIFATNLCGISDREQANEVLDLLCEHNWLTKLSEGKREVFHLNPLLENAGDDVLMLCNSDEKGSKKIQGFEDWSGETIELEDPRFDFGDIQSKIADRNRPEGFHDEFSDLTIHNQGDTNW